MNSYRLEDSTQTSHFFNEKDVAAIVKLSLPTLRRWRSAGEGPRFVKIGAAVRYRAKDVFDWMNSLAVGGNAEAEQRDEAA